MLVSNKFLMQPGYKNTFTRFKSRSTLMYVHMCTDIAYLLSKSIEDLLLLATAKALKGKGCSTITEFVVVWSVL